MAQGYLNFKIAATNEQLTSNAGLVLFGEYCKAAGVQRWIEKAFPSPGSGRGYPAYLHLFPLVLMLHAGGRELSDLRRIHSDGVLRRLLGLRKLPVVNAVNRWLIRQGKKGQQAMEAVNAVVVERFVGTLPEKTPLILDIDATVIESHKHDARYTYKGVPGYTPMLGHLNGGIVIHGEFREGNEAPASRNLAFIEACIDTLPKGRRVSWLRADSAAYQSDIFNYCETHGITFTIGARLDAAVRETIGGIETWQCIQAREGESRFYEVFAAERLHTMHDAEHAFRLIVVRKRATPILPGLEKILGEEALEAYAGERYSVIATNADPSIPIETIVRFYRQRGNDSENRIKAFKNGFNLRYLPTSNFEANAFYFQIGILAYNLFLLFSRTLETSWQKHTVETIRYKLYHTAGKLVSHGRTLVLKIPDALVETFHAIRLRILQYALE